MEQLPVTKDASQGDLLGRGLVISHLKNNHVREGKERKKLIGFLKLILPSTVAIWEPGVPSSGCRSLSRLRCDSLLEIESLGRSGHWVPGQAEACRPPGTPGLADP